MSKMLLRALAMLAIGTLAATPAPASRTTKRARAGATPVSTPTQAGVRAAIVSAPAFTATRLAELPASDWPTNGGSVLNQRYSPLEQINRDTVSGLRALWRASLRGSGLARRTSGQAQPLEYQGTIYTITGNDDVFAISVDTGRVLWEYQAHLNPAGVVPCCGWVSRGVAIGEGKVFVGQLDNKLVALDQHTGRPVWSVQSETLQDGGFTITAAPLYYDGLVIIGHAGGELAIRGRLKAFDAKTGKLRWVFYTIPGPGEPGHESWPADNDAWKHGGGSIWQTPALDPQLGLLYVSTDNPGPDLNGAVRAGDNLFTSSVLALDAKTGRYRWHYQEIHHDIWDYGAPNPVVLFDARVGGQPRKGLAQLSKDGYAYLLDRVTGKPLLEIPEQPVMQSAAQRTSLTQPIPVGDDIVPHSIDIAPDGYDLVNAGRTFTAFDERPTLYKPLAGVSWPPSSYDPAAHVLFVCANDAMGVATRNPDASAPPTTIGERYIGGTFGHVDAPRRGIIAALDVTTNHLIWRRQWTQGCSSGSANTAAGLLFIGRSDGRLLAYDKRNGHVLWDFQTDAPIAAPPTVFQYKGTEYVAVMAAGSVYSGSLRGDGLWLFSLHGKLGPRPPLPAAPVAFPPAAATGEAAAGAGATRSVPGAPTALGSLVPMPAGAADVARGRQIYTENCQPCHGSDGQGSHGEGAPLTTALSASRVYSTASTGRRQMPSFRGALSPIQLRDVAGFIAQDLTKRRHGVPSQ